MTSTGPSRFGRWRIGAPLLLLTLTFPVAAQTLPDVTGLVWCPGSKICLKWNAMPGASSYALYRGVAANLPDLLETGTVDSCRISLYSQPITGATIVDKPASCGLFWYLVRARSAAGEGSIGDATAGPRQLDSGGNCASTCAPAQSPCTRSGDCCSGWCEAGVCVPHCGGCAFCSSNHVAVRGCPNAGTCSGTCETEWGDCNGDLEHDGCETPVNTTSRCGSCSVSCPTNHVVGVACTDGACTWSCQAGWENCNQVSSDGCETWIAGSILDCGSCGNVCPAPPPGLCEVEACTNGTCGYACATLQGRPMCGDCDGIPANGCETGLGSDENCGGCGDDCDDRPFPGCQGFCDHNQCFVATCP